MTPTEALYKGTLDCFRDKVVYFPNISLFSEKMCLVSANMWLIYQEKVPCFFCNIRYYTKSI